MTKDSIIEDLNERVKELSCLYDLASLASEHLHSYEDILQSMVNRISLAWKHSKSAIGEIVVEQDRFISDTIPPFTIYQQSAILVEGQQIGSVKVHYPSLNFSKEDFLQEEQLLLNKIAQEITNIVEYHRRNKREEILRRSVERNDRLAILGEITAGIAHELNTPLGNILGFSELIAEKSNEDQVKKDAERISTSALHAREVVKKLMFFSCEMPQQMQSIAINSLVEDALKLLKPSLESSGIILNFIEDSKNPLGRLDPIQITQEVFNLMINAIHASKPGNDITVSLSSADKNLNLTIQDYGTGISDAIQHKIFEPFFTTKDVGEGSGLGLSVVHGIVKSHGGSIRFSTEEGKGTTFNVNIPLHL